MLSTEIYEKLKNIKNFIGVYACDEMPKFIQVFPQCLVANTDNHNQIGSHWIAIFIDDKGGGEYFDSYGLPPMKHEFIQYLENNTKTGFTYNKVSLQCFSCVTCGEYCCAYIIIRSAGYSHRDFLKLFNNNPNTNDYIIKSIFGALDSEGWNRILK